jgi:ketosteroid isomerase-like protein
MGWSGGPCPVPSVTRSRSCFWSWFESLLWALSDGQVALDDLVVPLTDDVAYTLGTEHGQAMLGDETVSIDWRVTNIYRREGGGWKIVHHHTDVSPEMVEALDRFGAEHGQ